MRSRTVVIIGAGIGGLVAALDLARMGCNVTVLEAQATPGGKIRKITIGDQAIAAGPTVFTMRWVFDALFADAGTSTQAQLKLTPLTTLARHAWSTDERLDLFADYDRTLDAIGTFAGRNAARGYASFCERARLTFEMLDGSFIQAARPSATAIMMHASRNRPGDVLKIKPYTTLWRALGEHFADPRLRQLFGRYATYSGSSPFLASATLMLIAHVERQGVYALDGGMFALADAVARLAQSNGATLRYGTPAASITVDSGRANGVLLTNGEHVQADVVLHAGDTNALAAGFLGPAARRAIAATPRPQRSQSALTLALVAPTSGFDLAHHNVFFSRDYAAEFDDVFTRNRIPRDPTVYVCAQDRSDDASTDPPDKPNQPERLLCLINAPASGDTPSNPQEIASCPSRIFQQLARCGLSVQPSPASTVMTTPADFEALFPATGGALYGPVSHGWMAPFQRPGARSNLPGLYLAGGSTHPGAGVPMATLSGRVAASAILADLSSISRSPTAGTRGGISMR